MRTLAVLIFVAMVFIGYNSCGALNQENDTEKKEAAGSASAANVDEEEAGNSPDADPPSEAGSTTEPGGTGDEPGVCGYATVTGSGLSTLVIKGETSVDGEHLWLACQAAIDACAADDAGAHCAAIADAQTLDCNGEAIEVGVKEKKSATAPACPISLVLIRGGEMLRRYPVQDGFDVALDLDSAGGQYLCAAGTNSDSAVAEDVCAEQQGNCEGGEPRKVFISSNDGDGTESIYWECGEG